MARPKSTKPSCIPTLRGNALAIRLSFGEVKYPTPVLAKVEPEFVAKNGYVKPSHPDYLTINETLAGATERLEQAFAIALAADEVTTPRIKQEYLRLTDEATASAVHKHLRQQVEQKAEDFTRRLRDERRLLARVRDEDLDGHIADLEAKLIELHQRRDNLRRATGTYHEDLLVTYLTRYATRKGVATMAATTSRSHLSLVSTIRHFEPNTRIQDVDEAWMTRFQDWLVSTPCLRPVYKFIKNKDYTGEAGQKKLVIGELLYHREDETRKNSTVKRYIERIKSCLRYYKARPSLLPPSITITDNYKLYEFDLTEKEDNVVALEEEELYQLLAFNDFATKAERRALDVILFLCATGLRFVDLKKVRRDAIIDGTIHLVARKTRKHKITVDIPLNFISTSILEKYGYDMSTCKVAYGSITTCIQRILSHDNGKTFPSLQQPHTIMNYSGDKEVIDETIRANAIGTHTGRRTFINLCLDYNVPLNKIIGMTGHRNVSTLMVYANKRKNVKKYMRNILQLPHYDQQDYSIADVLSEVSEISE